ncbi:hypothetical protein D3C76_1330020 [compost metagenome]
MQLLVQLLVVDPDFPIRACRCRNPGVIAIDGLQQVRSLGQVYRQRIPFPGGDVQPHGLTHRDLGLRIVPVRLAGTFDLICQDRIDYPVSEQYLALLPDLRRADFVFRTQGNERIDFHGVDSTNQRSFFIDTATIVVTEIRTMLERIASQHRYHPDPSITAGDFHSPLRTVGILLRL